MDLRWEPFSLTQQKFNFAFDKNSHKEIEVMTTLQIISILLKYRANISLQDNEGRRPTNFTRLKPVQQKELTIDGHSKHIRIVYRAETTPEMRKNLICD